jgi:hypothetical protein
MAEPIIAIQDLTHSFGRGMLRKPVLSEVSHGDFDGSLRVWQDDVTDADWGAAIAPRGQSASLSP